MSRTVVHLGTRLEAVFGVLDESGNVVEKIPVRLEIAKFDADTYRQLRATILKERAKALAALTRKST